MQHRTGPAQNSRRQRASFDSCLPGEPTRKAPHLLQVAPRIGQRLRAGPGPRRLFSPTRCRLQSATAICQLRRTARAGSPLGPGRLAMTGRSYPASSPGRRHHESRPDSDHDVARRRLACPGLPGRARGRRGTADSEQGAGSPPRGPPLLISGDRPEWSRARPGSSRRGARRACPALPRRAPAGAHPSAALSCSSRGLRSERQSLAAALRGSSRFAHAPGGAAAKKPAAPIPARLELRQASGFKSRNGRALAQGRTARFSRSTSRRGRRRGP